ncbi:choice-of-anchor tandem repeat GloVer-containing protein [Erythrobacter sp. GH1-10]|uniref:choice-of-anchor tandem repeat GloVer-containing protein n=1 Tax=Erythrobacter sp. GH1-10 TaxID=3349334 RepID=UPI003877A95D
MTEFFKFGETDTDGYLPTGQLIQASDGYLYGVTQNGGAFGGGGTVFKISLNGDYTQLHSFGNGEFDGDTPSGGLVEAADGNFYGVTTSGGDNTCSEIPSGVGNCGTIFRMSPSGETQIMHSFGDPAKSDEGVSPDGPLVQGADGSLYGVTQGRGENGFGTIFKMSLDGEVEHFFSFGPRGDHPGAPQGGLMRASDGNIYGSTSGGGLGLCGSRGCGTIFRISSGDEVTVIYTFGLVDGTSDGRGPDGFLTEGRDGALYGSTLRGGSVDINGGTIFRVTKAGEKTTLASFGPFLDKPTQPYGGLVEGPDGALFGTTESGGNDLCQGARCPLGALFRYGPE